MAGRLRRGFTFANVCSFLALTIALGTGGAYAANTVFSTDIVDGEVKFADLGASAVSGSKILNGGVGNVDLADSAVSASKLVSDAVGSTHVLNESLLGADVAPNTLTGADILESSLAKVPDADTVDGLDSTALIGPRAYGRVSPDSCAITTPFACTVSKSKGVSGVTRPNTGLYCITVTGVDPTSFPLIATVDWLNTLDAEGNASVMTMDGGFCPGGPFPVVTERQSPVAVAAAGGGTTSVAGNSLAANNVAFTFIVP